MKSDDRSMTRQAAQLVRAAVSNWGLACLIVSTASIVAWGAEPVGGPAPSYDRDVLPILRKYCSACHNDSDREGKLSFDSYDKLLAGGANGAVVTPGHGSLSRLVRVVNGSGEPKMPPKGSEAPAKSEIELLVRWIDAGAKGPSGAAAPLSLNTPKIPVTAPARDSIHALAIAPSGNRLALARHGSVEVYSLPDRKLVHRLEGLRGVVSALDFSRDGEWLAAAGGEPSLLGEAKLWRLSDVQQPKTFAGARDTLQAVRLSPDGKLLAAGGYDQRIKLWDTSSGAELRVLEGHNGPVFDLAFRPDGNVLASASGDRTVKLWNVATGARLDTLNQPLLEQYAVAFSNDGQRVAAGGVDNRIRVWQVSDSAKEGTNPLVESVFAHELAILRLAFSADGKSLVSSAEDRLVKVWDFPAMQLRETLAPQADWVAGLAVHPDGSRVFVGRLDGNFADVPLTAGAVAPILLAEPASETPPEVDYGAQPAVDQLPAITEVEPNDAPTQATAVTWPARVAGKIQAAAGTPRDVDLFRFEAKQGEQWIFETNAARKNSPLDSKLEVLDAQGRPLPRLLLRAVRDSEIEFRSMDSNQRGVRLKYWEEMLLNQYVYINGEVIKHFQQRRGPDADSNFYPENGARYSFFETSSRAHALGQPAYVVVPYRVGAKLPNNGLPIFTLNYENDDDGFRQLGKDSRLTFVAPADGVYLVRVSDVRSFHGENYAYELVGRRPQPDFQVTVTGANPTVNAGSGKAFLVKAERRDNFQGPIQVELTGMPAGFRAPATIVIQAGLHEARGFLVATEGATEPSAEALAAFQWKATARFAGKTIERPVSGLGAIKLGPPPKLTVKLAPDLAASQAAAASDDGVPVVVIEPGRRATFRLSIDRRDFKDRVQFEIENLPHGVIVDDIGLNGVLIPEGQTERTLFLSCETWVPQTDRLFHAVAKVDGDQVSLPLRLQVRSGAAAASVPATEPRGGK